MLLYGLRGLPWRALRGGRLWPSLVLVARAAVAAVVVGIFPAAGNTFAAVAVLGG
jgi:hypothetical protein